MHRGRHYGGRRQHGATVCPVLPGKVDIVVTGPDGDRVVMESRKAGDTIGESALLQAALRDMSHSI